MINRPVKRDVRLFLGFCLDLKGTGKPVFGVRAGVLSKPAQAAPVTGPDSVSNTVPALPTPQRLITSSRMVEKRQESVNFSDALAPRGSLIDVCA